jgi:putative membrane protein
MSGNMETARKVLRKQPNRALAIGRTTLANDRTFLSFLRTFISFLAAGVSIIILMENPLINAAGWVLILVSVLILIGGIRRYYSASRLLADFALETLKEKKPDQHA